MKTQLRTLYLACIIFLSFPMVVLGQATIASQSFEGSGWSFTPNPITYSIVDDIWAQTPSGQEGLTATDGANFWFMQDLDNPNGGVSGQHTLTFASQNVSSYTNVTLSFDWNVFEWDNGDDINYEVFIDGISQGNVLLVNGGSDFSDSGTTTINIPDGSTSVYIILKAEQDGGADYGFFDNVVLSGTLATATFISVAPSSLNNLDYFTGSGPSVSQSFTVSAQNLTPATGNLTLTAPINFEISIDDTTFSNSFMVPYTGGTLANTLIYVRLKSGLANNTYSGNVDISGGGAPNATVSVSGSVAPQPVLGWQITTTDVPFKIDFETTVSNANNGAFNGSGFQPNPTIGQLDSNTWSATGLSDGDLLFGTTGTTGDFANGISSGSIGPGGIYAFNTGSSATSLGVQPGGSDFAPGAIILRLQNQTGITITNLDIEYSIFVFNDQPRSNSFNFGHSSDNVTYITVPSADFTSGEAPATNPTWEQNEISVPISGISIAPGDFYYLRWTGDDVSGSGSRDQFALDNITMIANPTTTNYTYNNGWSPSDPSGIASSDDNLQITNGTASLIADTEVNNLTIDPGATLNIEQVLSVNGIITNNGNLVFISDGTKLGQLAAMSSAVTIPGVTVQRYIPARRAFRFISSSVTTTTSIHDNWQEGAISSTDNPNPGFGTHISGNTVDQQNGFDATVTGNPSLFLFDNVAQTWGQISDTDVNILTAGKAYRLFVRGDRSIDLTNNGTTPTNTTLRATGSLNTAAYSNPNNSMSQTAGGFNFIGNPYRAIVNMNDVLANSTNLNTNQYYVWDPNQNTRGAYVTVSLPGGTNSLSSDANQYLQPGQAAFVTTATSAAASILFEQTDKAPFQNPTAVFRGVQNTTEASIVLQLYEAQAFDSGGSVADGILLKFDSNESNAVLLNDATKLGNIDENLAVVNGPAAYLSIENRALPVDGEVLQLFNSQYRHSNYTYKAELSGFSDKVTVYLKDNYLNSQTLLTNDDSTIIDFSVDENISASLADDRFSFVFDVNGFSVEKQAENIFVVYPNPSKNGNFFISASGMAGENVQISMHNLLGQEVYKTDGEVGGDQQIEIKTPQLNTGIYVVKMTCQGETFTKKLILQ